MNIISYIHKSVELLFQVLGLVEVWPHRNMELSPVPHHSCWTAGVTSLSLAIDHSVQHRFCWVLSMTTTCRPSKDCLNIELALFSSEPREKLNMKKLPNESMSLNRAAYFCLLQNMHPRGGQCYFNT
jgi:hypothetical protein